MIRMDDKRRGVVLFITLSVIAAMLAMVGVIFTYLEKSRDNASYTSAMIEADLLFRDGVDTIGALLKRTTRNKEAKEEILSILYLAPVTLQAEDNEEMFTTLECKPLDKGVNINWLRLENNSSAQHLYSVAQMVFDRLVERYNIQNAAKLLSDIKAAVGGDDGYSEESKGRIEKKKGILNLSQMESIARTYRFGEDDSVVERIEWEKYFSFDLHRDKVDGNFISAELISLLFDLEIEAVKEEWLEGDDLKSFVASHGGNMKLFRGKLFAKEPIERMYCRVSYSYQGGVYALGFEYLEGKAEKFEFYGKQ